MAEFKDLPTHCYECKEPIDIVEGYYVVDEWEHACSEECTRKMLGKKVFNEGKTEWEEKGDSDIYYWTDWSQLSGLIQVQKKLVKNNPKLEQLHRVIHTRLITVAFKYC